MNNTTPPRRATAGALLIAGAVLALPVTIVLAWLGWQFERLDPLTQEWLRRAIFIAPFTLAGALLWRWFGVSSSIANWFDVLKTMAEKRQGARAQSVHIAINERNTTQPAIEGEIVNVPALLAPPKIPTFAELLDNKKIGAGLPLILGYHAATHDAQSGSWLDLYSTGVGGMTGSGKSWLIAFLAAQSVAQGARLLAIDPHYGDGESLGTRLGALSAAFMRDVASDGKDIEAVLRLAADKLEGRRKGRGGSWPLLLIVDEWTSLLRGKLGDQLTATALDIAEQGRKYGVFAVLAAQAWQVDAAGPVRDRLASHYVLRQRPDQARYQLGLRAGQLPLDVRFLKDAEAYMLTVKGDLSKVVIPHMTSADIARAATLIPQESVTVAGLPFGLIPATQGVTPSASVAVNRPATVAATSASQSATEARRAAALFVAEKKTPAEIVKELRNVTSKEGTRYQSALNEVLDLIRQGMGGQ